MKDDDELQDRLRKLKQPNIPRASTHKSTKKSDDDDLGKLEDRLRTLKEPSIPHAPTHKPLSLPPAPTHKPQKGGDDELGKLEGRLRKLKDETPTHKPQEKVDPEIQKLEDRIERLKQISMPHAPTHTPHMSDDDDDPEPMEIYQPPSPPRINPRKPPQRRNSDPSRKGFLSLQELDDLRKASEEEKARRRRTSSSVTLEQYQELQLQLLDAQDDLRKARAQKEDPEVKKQLEDEIRQLRQYLEDIHPVIEREYPVAQQRIEHLEKVIQDLEQQPAKVLKDPEQQQRIKDLEEELEELKRRPPPPPMVTKDPSDEEQIKSLRDELRHVKELLKSTESVAEKYPQAEEEIKQLRGAILELQNVLSEKSGITAKGEEEIRQYILGLEQEIEQLRSTGGAYEFQSTGPSEGEGGAKKKPKPSRKSPKDFDWKEERKDVTQELMERSREERKARSRKLFEAQVTQQDDKGPSEREVRQQLSLNELIRLKDQYPDRIDYTTLSLPELDNYMRGIDNYRGKILTHLNRFGEDEELRRVTDAIGPYLVEMNTYKRQLQQPSKPRSRTPSPPKTIATSTPPPPPPPRPRSKSPSQQQRTPVFTTAPAPPPPPPQTTQSSRFSKEEIERAQQLFDISRTGSTSEIDEAIKEMKRILKDKKANGQRARNENVRGYFKTYYGDSITDPPKGTL